MTTNGYVMTVAGPIDPSTIRYTLPHEHLYTRFWEIDGRFDSPHLLDDDDVMADELSVFQRQGGNCVVDLTLPDIGRKPERLRALSEKTGLKIIMGCGWYRRLYYLPEEGLERRPVRDLAAELLREIREGVGDTGIRPGVIGEIGCEKSWVSPVEERVHRAAARAQRETGLGLVTHSRLSEVALEQLTIFEDEGADLSRVVIGHCDSHPYLDYYLRILDRGAWLSFDNIGSATTLGHAPAGKHHDRLADLIVKLIERGFANRILLSHDVCESFQLRYYGGAGFGFLFEHFLPMLRARGVEQEMIDCLTQGNPRRWLSVHAT
ncbi:MAG TPA: hypothetical protein VGR87_02680 [Candidatus Limnocylindria bacterium]|jgi:phosphotriesterase-related protein|nr:hypothetical protein [Candidatus Limnocylindria bacterium]